MDQVIRQLQSDLKKLNTTVAEQQSTIRCQQKELDLLKLRIETGEEKLNQIENLKTSRDQSINSTGSRVELANNENNSLKKRIHKLQDLQNNEGSRQS